MYISARVDYALRALLALGAGAPPEATTGLSGEVVARSQDLPVKFVENLLVDLRRAGFVTARRGPFGGYRLARPADKITLAEVFRALEGPLAEVRGERPDQTEYHGDAVHLQAVWVAVRAALRQVLETVTLRHVLDGDLPAEVAGLVADREAWDAPAWRPTPPVT